MKNTPQRTTGWRSGWYCLCAALLAAGCSHSGDNGNDDSKNVAPKPAPPSAISTAPEHPAPVPAPAIEPSIPPVKAPKPALYAVTIVPEKPTVQLSSKRVKTTIAIHNIGRDIPALSLWFDGTGSKCTIHDARSDRTAHPDPAMVDSGQGWDFGPLPRGKTTHITLHLEAKKPGVQEFLIKPYAIAEDEGDTERTIDGHIQNADRKLTVEVLSM